MLAYLADEQNSKDKTKKETVEHKTLPSLKNVLQMFMPSSKGQVSSALSTQLYTYNH